MLWIIEPGRETLSEEYEKDLERLGGNAALAGHLTRREISFSAAHANTPLAAPALPPGEPIYILAHAGNDPVHGFWIAGANLNTFITMLVAKFGAQLNNRTVYLLVCIVGSQTATLANLLLPHANNVELYVPNGLMYISAAGIPHVMNPGAYPSLQAANDAVAGYKADFTKLAPRSQTSGEGWSGARVSGAPAAVAVLANGDVRDEIRGAFDPDEDEA
jgi:hypothetical protein